jgi:hypothetical protein
VFVDPLIESARIRQEQNEQRQLRLETRSVTSSVQDVLNNHQRSQEQSVARSNRLAARNEYAAAARYHSDGDEYSETTGEEESVTRERVVPSNNVIIPSTPHRTNGDDLNLFCPSSVSTSSTRAQLNDNAPDGTAVTTPHGNIIILSLNVRKYSVCIISPTFFWNGLLSKKDDVIEVHRTHVNYWYSEMLKQN